MTLSWTLLAALGGTALVSAGLAALFTLLLVRRALRRRVLPQLRQELERTLERLGDVVEQRVRKGVVDGVRSLPSQDTLRWTREAVSDAASDLFRGGLGSLLGDKPPSK